VSDPINLAGPSVKYRNIFYLHWFSSSLKCCIKKTDLLLEDTKNPSLLYTIGFFLIVINWLNLPLSQTGFVG
jgi:hypothetical protein